VTVGTFLEGSHVPLHSWLRAIHMVRMPEHPATATELAQALGVTYKTALSMHRRVRPAVASKMRKNRTFEKVVADLLRARPARQRPEPARDGLEEIVELVRTAGG
jgi:hypothetical protein